MSLYTEATGVAPSAAARQAVVTTTVDAGRFEELAALVEAAMLSPLLNHDAMAKGGIVPGTESDKVVPFAVKQVQPTKASVTFYYNGRVVWAGIAPIALP